MNKCTLPCDWMRKHYIVADCNEETGSVDIDTRHSRSSIFTYVANAGYPNECNLEGDFVVPAEKEKKAGKAIERLTKDCHIMDIHHHPEDDPDLMPGSHLHVLCEQIDSKKLRPLVRNLMDIHDASWWG